MALNPKVLEAAENAFAPQLSDDMKAHLHRAVERAVAVADLVEHRELNEALVERNEARGEADIVTKERDRARREAEELGKQLAALHEAVELIADLPIAHITPLRMQNLRTVFTDTAKAAALYQRVPKSSVVV